MLGHLVLVEHGADGHADLRRAAQGLRLARHAGGDFGQIALGGGDEVLALAGALARQIRIAADDQPLAGKVGRGDRRHVALVEQRHLQISAADQALQRGRAQRRDPVEAGGAQILLDARLRDHAAIADQHDMVDGEAALQLGHLIGHGRGIAGVAFEHLDGDGTAVGCAQKPIDDLQLALLAVAAVAAPGERAAAAFDVARRDVVEHQRPALQMALCQRGLDRALTLEEPVERGVEFVLADVAERQFDAEAGGGGDRIERLGGGELGGRRDDAADDHGHDEVDRPMAVGLARGLGPDDPVEADGARRAQHGGHVAMRQRALDGEGLLARGQHDPALQDAAQTLDVLGRPMAEVEQRAFAHGPAVPIALAQQDGGRGAAIGDGFDVHGR